MRGRRAEGGGQTKPAFRRFLPSALPAALHAGGMPVLSWTVRTPEERAIVAAHADRPIFEGPHTA